jgi:23S rRNA (adenine2030-N6)-methyltransferase
MLSYQHAYHAGGPADLHKHAALAGMLALLTAKKRPISYIESHAGRGLYDLGAAAAAKTGEALRGVARLTEAAHPYWTAIRAARAAGGDAAYPGSPFVARALLRPQDRLALMELHPAEHAALSATMAGKGVAIHRRDGREGLRALTPPEPRRGLALIDPSYEVKTEYAETAVLALEVASRWPEGVVMVWYPILDAPRHGALIGPVEAVAPEGMLIDEVAFRERPGRGMVGSGLLILNAPFGAEKALAEAHGVCAAVLTPVATTPGDLAPRAETR